MNLLNPLNLLNLHTAGVSKGVSKGEAATSPRTSRLL